MEETILLGTGEDLEGIWVEEEEVLGLGVLGLGVLGHLEALAD